MTEQELKAHDEFGIFRVDDASGRIGNLMPGDPGYAAAALSTARSTIIFAEGRSPGAVKTVTVGAGEYYGTYLVQRSSSGLWRAQNPWNAVGLQPLAFLSVAAANPDAHFEHVHSGWTANSSGNSRLTMRWENRAGGGDKDFNDCVIAASGLQAARASAFTYDANATDVDGDALTYTLTKAPASATIDASTGQLTWSDPREGVHTFVLAVSDGKGAVTTQTFDLQVSYSNTAPTATNVTYDVDGSLRIDLLQLIADAEQDALEIMVSSASHGSLTRNPDGTYTYKAADGFTGLDYFTYTASDGYATTTARVKLNVLQ
jgi:hypothetical protein